MSARPILDRFCSFFYVFFVKTARNRKIFAENSDFCHFEYFFIFLVQSSVGGGGGGGGEGSNFQC